MFFRRLRLRSLRSTPKTILKSFDRFVTPFPFLFSPLSFFPWDLRFSFLLIGAFCEVFFFMAYGLLLGFQMGSLESVSYENGEWGIDQINWNSFAFVSFHWNN